MSLILSGTDGLSDVDGTAATPAIRGTDANAGIFFPAADTIGFAGSGAEVMRIDSIGRVGIGTTSPSQKLVLSDAGAGNVLLCENTATSIQTYLQSGGTTGVVGTLTNHPFTLFTNNTERMRIDTSGNVGIGTSSPSSKLYVRAATNANLRVTDASGTLNLSAENDAGSAQVAMKFNGSQMILDASGNLGIGTASPNEKLVVNGAIRSTNNAVGATATADSGVFYFVPTADAPSDPRTILQGVGTAGVGASIAFLTGTSASNTERMRISSTGDVGIGTTTPARKFHVRQGGVTTLANTNGSLFTDAGNAGILLGSDNVLGYVQGVTAAGTAAVNMVLQPFGGAVIVDQTSQSSNEKFGVVQSSASAVGAYFNAAAGNYANDIVVIRCARGSATTEYYFIKCVQVSTTTFLVAANGNVTNTNNSYGSLSDVKLKENIVDATPKLDSLMQVKVRNYNLKSDPTHKQLGVIAQELEQVFPAMVEESPDKDEEGNDLGTTTKSVKYSVFVPMLIKAIQEQQALITALTARITALESN